MNKVTQMFIAYILGCILLGICTSVAISRHYAEVDTANQEKAFYGHSK